MAIRSSFLPEVLHGVLANAGAYWREKSKRTSSSKTLGTMKRQRWIDSGMDKQE
jgi:hypothetical protein